LLGERPTLLPGAGGAIMLFGVRWINRDVVRALISHHRKGKPSPEECMVSVEKRGTHPEENLYGIVLDEDDPA